MTIMEKRDHEHPNPKVRMTAVEKLEDPEILVQLACSDESPRVRLTATLRFCQLRTVLWRQNRHHFFQLRILQGKLRRFYCFYSFPQCR